MLFDEKTHLVVLWVDTLVIKLRSSNITGSKCHVIEVIPEEKTSLLFIIEESMHPLVVVHFPLLFEVEVLKTLGQMGDHDFNPY